MSAKELFAALLSIDNNVRSEAEVRIFIFLFFFHSQVNNLQNCLPCYQRLLNGNFYMRVYSLLSKSVKLFNKMLKQIFFLPV